MSLGISREVKAALKDGAEGLARKLLHGGKGACHFNVEICVKTGDGKTEEVIKGKAADYSPKYRAFNALFAHNGNGKEGNNGHDHGHYVSPAAKQNIKGSKGHSG